MAELTIKLTLTFDLTLFRCQSCAELKEETSKTAPEGCWTGKAYKTRNINQTLWCQYSISYKLNQKCKKKKIPLLVILKYQTLSTIVNHLNLYYFRVLKNSLVSKFNREVFEKTALFSVIRGMYKTHNIHQRASLFNALNGDTQYIYLKTGKGEKVSRVSKTNQTCNTVYMFTHTHTHTHSILVHTHTHTHTRT